jgi:hypothetical protein
MPVGTRRAFMRNTSLLLGAAAAGTGGAPAVAATAAEAEAGLEAALRAVRTPVRFWWRHDDVGVDSAAFARILAIAQRRQIPIALAVVPKILKQDCVRRILACPQATVVQHGIAHKNNAASGRQIELGGTADRKLLKQQLEAGRKQLAGVFGTRFVPMQVPPWNIIAPDLVPSLPGLGFTALSTAGKRPAAEAAPGLRQVNIHLDLYRWNAPRGSLTYEEVLTALAARVRSIRGEPLGILTHHSVMDDAAFAILDRVLACLQRQAVIERAGIGGLVQAWS